MGGPDLRKIFLAEDDRVAVVTGGNRGIGFATVKRLCRVFDGKIVLTARNVWKGKKALARLKMFGCLPAFHGLDVASRRSRDAFADHVRQTYGRLDMLVNNAGVMFGNESTVPFRQQVSETLATNFYGTVFLCHALFPLLRPHSRVVNVASTSAFLGGLESSHLRHQFARPDIEYPDLFKLMRDYEQAALAGVHVKLGWGDSSFLVSQLGLVALTILQQRFFDTRASDGCLANAFSPGECSTRMTGFTGDITPGDAARNIVLLVLLPPNTTHPAGQYLWHNMTAMDWKGTKPADIDPMSYLH